MYICVLYAKGGLSSVEYYLFSDTSNVDAIELLVVFFFSLSFFVSFSRLYQAITFIVKSLEGIFHCGYTFMP